MIGGMEIPSLDPFLDYWRSIHGRTRRVIELIPAEHFETPDRDGAWSLGDLTRHLALLERWMFVETIHGRPSRYRGCSRKHAEGREATLALYDALHEASRALVASLGDAGLRRRCTTPGGATLSVWKWLRAMIEHESHHRGQIYLRLGQLGVATPPLFGLTAEEVAARSLEDS